MKYDKIILLGTGILFLECLAYVDKLSIPYVGYDMGDKPRKMTEMQAKKKGLCYCFKDRREVYCEIRAQERPILLLSVINPRIIPADILAKKNILALNCHQALLPKHKGRNAEAWAIYEGDSVTGITWHKMEAAVDTGDILMQREIPITEETTSYELFRQQLRVAYECFTEFMPKVLSGTESYVQQEPDSMPGHYSYETIEEGRLDTRWDGARISRFLRAMDYGGLAIMKAPVICMEGKDYMFKAYRINKLEEKAAEESVTMKEDMILIQKQNYEIKLLKCRLCAGKDK